MNSLATTDRQIFERCFGMSSGYVLDFTDRTFAEFVFEAVGIDIHAEKYKVEGTSKAKKLRTFRFQIGNDGFDIFNPSP